MNHDQKDQDESAPSRTDTPEIQPGGEGIPPSAKGPKSLMSRFRTWYYNRHTFALEPDEPQEQPKRNARFFKRVGGRPVLGPVKLKLVRARRGVKDFFLDHPRTNFCSEQLVLLVLELVSAFIFAYGFRAFIAPSRVPLNVIEAQNLLSGFTQPQCEALDLATAASLVNPSHLVSGGASGIGQVLTRIVLLCGVTNIPSQTLQSLFYFVVNLPIIILGFLKVGKKFTFYSLVNVILTSILIDAIPQSWCELINIYDDNLARALAGGLTTGVSSGLALRIGTSTGGVDIISLYVAEKKGTTVGKYSLIMNTCTVITYTVLCFFHAPADGGVDALKNGATQLTMSLYTIIYFFTQTIIVDSLNTKNKKTELQVFTTSKVMNIYGMLLGLVTTTVLLPSVIGKAIRSPDISCEPSLPETEALPLSRHPLTFIGTVSDESLTPKAASIVSAPFIGLPRRVFSPSIVTSAEDITADNGIIRRVNRPDSPTLRSLMSTYPGDAPVPLMCRVSHD